MFQNFDLGLSFIISLTIGLLESIVYHRVDKNI